MQESNDWTCVGVIMGAHGVAGSLKIKSFCQVANSIQDYNPLMLEDFPYPINLRIISNLKGDFQVELSNVTDRDAASRLKGKLLFAEKSNLPSLPDSEYYYSDLIGIEVRNRDNEIIGKVLSVEDFGAGTFLEILTVLTSKTILVPFTEKLIPKINISRQFIILNQASEVTPNDQ